MKRADPIPTLLQMEAAIASIWGVRTHIIVPNISWGLNLHECDLLIVTKSNYAIEVEIKRSKADLKKDAEKCHGHKSKRIKELWFAIPEQLKNCIDLIPPHAGIIIVKKYPSAVEYEVPRPTYCAVRERKPITNKSAVKLSDKEVLTVMRLGCMRIWNLKHKVNCLIGDLKAVKTPKPAKIKVRQLCLTETPLFP